MKRPISIISFAVLGMAAQAWAQVADPNERGAAFGQWHTIVRDVEASKRFWTTVGCVPIRIDGEDVMKFPGILIFLKKGSPAAGGNYGSTLNHVSFLVPDSQKTIEQWK